MEQFIHVRERSEKAVTITLLGYVGDWQFSAERLIPYLRDYRDEKIKLEIYSFGGTLADALAIVDYIQSNQLDVTSYLFGFCGSAATVVASGTNQSYVGEHSSYFIHNASGSNDEIREKLNDRMVAIYVSKTGASEEQVREWMENETMFSAQEAITAGFADGLIADSDYLDVAAVVKEIISNNSQSNEMEILALWNKLFPSRKVDKAEEIEAKLTDIATELENSSGDDDAIKDVSASLENVVKDVTAQKEAMSEILKSQKDLADIVAELVKDKKEGDEQIDKAEQTISDLKKQINEIKAMRKEIAPGSGDNQSEGAGAANKDEDDTDTIDTTGKDKPYKVPDNVYANAKRSRFMN